MIIHTADPGAGTPDRSRPPAPGPLRPFDFPPVEVASISAGVPLMSVEARDFPIVTLHLLVDAGSAREDPERAGLAAFTSDLLDAGAGGRSATELAESIEALGVHLDAGASWDAAYISLTALRSRLEPALDILADLLRRPDFPLQEFERVREQKIAEILQRRSDPRSLATEAAARFIYSRRSPFHRPAGGTRETLLGLTRSDLVQFHQERFRPGGTYVIVAGDIAAAEIIPLLEQRLDGWAGVPEPLASTPLAEPRTREPQVVIVHRPGSVQSEIRVGHLGVSRDTADYFPIIVANAVLGGMFTSRLNLSLRERHGFTYGASSGFTMRREPGAFVVSTAVQTEVTAAAVREIFTEMRGIRDSPVTDAELTDARNYLAGTFPLRLQTTDGTASRLAELALFDLPRDYFDTYRERILQVDAAQAQAAAQRHLRPDEAAVVVVGDGDHLREALQQLEIAPVQLLTPDDLDDLEDRDR
jgi:zinc protease